jgi:beta-apo-4'-carotenal oxygenase
VLELYLFSPTSVDISCLPNFPRTIINLRRQTAIRFREPIYSIADPCLDRPDNMAPAITPFEATAVDSIPSTVNLCKTTFRAQKSKPIAYRLIQLRKLYWGLVDNADALTEACKKDLGKPTFETALSELDWCKNDIIFVTKNLEKWMKDESAPDMTLPNKLFSPRIKKEPLGTVLIIGAYNFPILLSLGPLIGAIAAGCTGVLKPSEVSPATAMVLKKIVEEYLDPIAFAVVNGAIPETNALLNEKWDKIFYTGSAGVGTIIAKKAAETLTPVCLELGGRNPAFVTKNADPRLAARRMLWGKLHNAGQVCISQNYIMVEKEILPAFIEQLKVAVKEFYPNGQKNSEDYARIVNNRHFHRIKKMIDDSKGKILIGGETEESDNFIEITVVLVQDQNDSMIVDESFGPLIPLLAVDNIEEAIRTANSVHSTPLGLYAFGSKAETTKSEFSPFCLS